MIEHKCLVNCIKAHNDLLHTNTSLRVLQLAAFTFDASVNDMFLALAAGGTLCLGSTDYLVSDLSQAINDMQATYLNTTPTVCSLLQPSRVPTLRTLLVGGEPMTTAVRDTWAHVLELFNSYGPTECLMAV